MLGVVAAVIAGGIVVGLVVPGSGDERVVSGAASARAFVAAWQRSLEGTWTADGSAVRAGLKNPVTIVQRPPDRLVRRGQAVSGSVGGREVSCVVDPNATVRCHDGGASPAYATAAARQVADLTSEVGGPAPVYLVSRVGASCFRLRLALVVAAPPYGQAARFCFDAATGAPTVQEHELDGVLDSQQFTAIRPAVNASDLQLPAALEQ